MVATGRKLKVLVSAEHDPSPWPVCDARESELSKARP
jgi:hypothetical protein